MFARQGWKSLPRSYTLTSIYGRKKFYNIDARTIFKLRRKKKRNIFKNETDDFENFEHFEQNFIKFSDSFEQDGINKIKTSYIKENKTSQRKESYDATRKTVENGQLESVNFEDLKFDDFESGPNVTKLFTAVIY